MAGFPAYRYPVEKHRAENSRKDAESLQEVVSCGSRGSKSMVVVASCFYFHIWLFLCCFSVVYFCEPVGDFIKNYLKWII